MRRVALLSLFVVGCTNQKLIPVQEEAPGAVDDLLEIETEFCTRPAEQVIFPVKLLLVVDTSGSMQFTDQPGLRVNAVRELMNTLKSQEDVLVATMGFGSNAYLDPPIADPIADPLFIPVADWQEPAFLQLKDVTTDYHGAFAAVQQHLLRDMLRTLGRTDADGSAELARTKYIVLFFSDGAPDPKCCTAADETIGDLGVDPYGCPPEPWEQPQPGVRYCEAAAELELCNESDFLDRFREGVEAAVNQESGTSLDLSGPNYGDGALVALNDLELDGNYNRSYQIEALAEDIMELGEEFGVGQIQINTALLFDSTLPDAVKEIYRLNKCRSERLLRRIAEIGGGQFRDFESSGEIDFLSFNFTSLKSGFQLISTYAHNLNALPPGGDPTVVDFRPDSDGDGLDDQLEFEIGTSAIFSDSDEQAAPALVGAPVEPSCASLDSGACPTDRCRSVDGQCQPRGDGYNDKIEHDRENIGFDGRFLQRPLTACTIGFSPDGIDTEDDDGDGLNGCEEQILKTNPRIADSDGDTLPDGIEVRVGTDPTLAEEDADDDFDGVPNLEEVRRATDPLVPDEDREEQATRYELIENGRTEDGRTCYRSITRSVHLATTAPRFTGGRRGYNDVLVWIAEAPGENPAGRVELRVACVRVQYIKPSFKDPLRGKVTLTEDQFLDLSDGATLDLLRNADIRDFCTYIEVPR